MIYATEHANDKGTYTERTHKGIRYSLDLETMREGTTDVVLYVRPEGNKSTHALIEREFGDAKQAEDLYNELTDRMKEREFWLPRDTIKGLIR